MQMKIQEKIELLYSLQNIKNWALKYQIVEKIGQNYI